MKTILCMAMTAALGLAEARGQGARPPRSNSLADRAAAVDASLGLPPSRYVDPYGDYAHPDPVVEFRTRPYGFTGGGRPFYTPRDHVRPIRRRDAFPPRGPVRILRGPDGGTLPDYLVPYGRRDAYRFAGWR